MVYSISAIDLDKFFSATIIYGSAKASFSDSENTVLPNYYEATVHRGRMHPYLTSLQKHRHYTSWSSMEDEDNNDEECLSHTGGTSDGDSGITTTLLFLLHFGELQMREQTLLLWKVLTKDMILAKI